MLLGSLFWKYRQGSQGQRILPAEIKFYLRNQNFQSCIPPVLKVYSAEPLKQFLEIIHLSGEEGWEGNFRCKHFYTFALLFHENILPIF